MTELWDLGNEKWTRDPATGRFRVDSYHGLGPPSREWQPADLERLIGAKVSGEAEIFPSKFTRSPMTGAILPPGSAPDVRTWLPPYGEKDTSELGMVGWVGLPRISQRLVLDVSRYPQQESRTLGADAGLPAVDTLPLPGAGSYFFITQCFGCRATTLIAIEYTQGVLFAWAPGSRKWVELQAQGNSLPECTLPRELWGVQLTTPAENDSPALVMPTDSGLAVVSIDILALTYSVVLLPGRCVGAPLPIGEFIAAPAVAADPALQLIAVDRKNPSQCTQLALPPTRPGCRFNRAFADRRMAIWLSDAGQLLYRPSEPVEQNRIAFVPWGEGVRPCFEFGAPYLSTTGKLWQLMRNTGTSAYEYLQLGQHIAQTQPVRSPKLSTGGTVFHLQTQLRGEPWLDQEIDDTAATELLIPLLESVPSKSVLRGRLEGVGGTSTAAVLRSGDRYRVVFELDASRGVTARFHVAQLSQPWLTQPFLYQGRLYLYHPGSNSGIPGWVLERERR